MPRTTKTNTKTPRIAPQTEIELLVSRMSTLELRVLALSTQVEQLSAEVAFAHDRIDKLVIMQNPKPKYQHPNNY